MIHMMTTGMEKMVFFLFAILCYLHSTQSEYILSHSRLPLYRQEGFTISLHWSDNAGEVSNLTLQLQKNPAANTRIPLYSYDERGQPTITGVTKLKHTTYYHDLDSKAVISLTHDPSSERLSMKGKFLHEKQWYDVDPYHPRIHKRSVGLAQEGDHIVTPSVATEIPENTDYVVPAEGSADWQTMNKAAELRQQWQHEESHLWNQTESDRRARREKRSNLPPDTDLTIQLFVIVDYYLYTTLSESARTLGWSGGVDDYIAFYIGHLVLQVGIRYRNIDSANFGTISTKFSYLLVAKSTADSPWTHPPSDYTNLMIDSGVGLARLDEWYTLYKATLPADADHYMLLTSLDLTSAGQGTSNAGLANLNGICGSFPTSISEFVDSTVLAHELGHNLGAQHDASGKYVMASSSGATSESTRGDNWQFSDLSVTYFESHIESISAIIDLLDSEQRSYVSGYNRDACPQTKIMIPWNCLANPGTYYSTWEGDSMFYFGQEIPVDEQCRLRHGDNFVFRGGTRYSTVCQQMWCYDLVADTGAVTSMSGAEEYTTCGDGQWCIEDRCVTDARAPSADDLCPLGDTRGRVFNNQAFTCTAGLTAGWCRGSSVAEECCAGCRALATPWLGPSCTYGDRSSACSPSVQCSITTNAAICCETCCPVVGPEEGYSCVAPTTTPTTSTPTTTTPTTTTPTTTTPTTTTPTTTTPTTTTPTTTTPTTTTPTTTTPTTTTPTTTTPTTTTPTTITPTTTTPTTTTQTTTTPTTTTPTTTTPTTTTPTTTMPTTTTPTTTTPTTTTPTTTTPTTTMPTTTTSTTTTPTTTMPTTTTPTTTMPTTTTPTTTTQTTTTPTTTTPTTTTPTTTTPTTTTPTTTTPTITTPTTTTPTTTTPTTTTPTTTTPTTTTPTTTTPTTTQTTTTPTTTMPTTTTTTPTTTTPTTTMPTTTPPTTTTTQTTTTPMTTTPTTTTPTTTTTTTTTPTTTTPTTTTPTTTTPMTTTPTTTTPTTTTPTTTTPTTITQTTTTPTTTMPTTTTPTTTTQTTTTSTTTTPTTTTPTTTTPTTTTPITTTPTTTTPTPTSTTTTPRTTTPTTTTPTTTTLTKTTPTTTTPTTTTPTTTSTTTTPRTTTPTTTTPTTTTLTTTTPTTTTPTTTTPATTRSQAASTTPLKTTATTTVFEQVVTVIKRFRIRIRIVSFTQNGVECDDPELLNARSDTATDMEIRICRLFRWYTGRFIRRCDTKEYSCGSVIAETYVEIEEDLDFNMDQTPFTAEDLQLELIPIMHNHTDFVIQEVPLVQDVNECVDPALNDCSPNSVCINTHGSYNCACQPEYSFDLSPHNRETGRVCAKPCPVNITCSLNEVCSPQAEADPVCKCADGKMCKKWIYAATGTMIAFALLIIAVIKCVHGRIKNRSDPMRKINAEMAATIAATRTPFRQAVFIQPAISGVRKVDHQYYTE